LSLKKQKPVTRKKFDLLQTSTLAYPTKKKGTNPELDAVGNLRMDY